MSSPRILIYLLRRDLRFADNPIFHEVIKSYQQSNHAFTHLLPLYVFPAQQIEVSGFLASESERSPYPEARSPAGGFWRCGKHRAKFLAESVFDLKKTLQGAGCGLEVRVGMIADVVQGILDAYATEKNEGEVVSVWMTSEEGVEEKREERAVRSAVEKQGKEFRLWQDEKYFIDDRDVPSKRPNDLPDLFTAYRKQVEPLREAPRKTLSVQGNLPPLPPTIPPHDAPFRAPSALEDTISCLYKPLDAKPDLATMKWPSNAESAHPFTGGESTGHDRIRHLLSSSSMTTYKDTRNGMIGTDFSTKLSAWLALGCITARQVHSYLLDFEEGRGAVGKGAQGFGKGENKGTGWVRFELLWRDYMRLCTRKHKQRLFHLEGFEQNARAQWKYPQKDKEVQASVKRFLEGKTGMGMVDASMRELHLTGYTSNRARQNVASFLAKHMGVDWRIGAEWYESNLIDYDVSSNWANWQYVCLGDRVFNPVKQSFDYDKKGEYVKLWVEELRDVQRVEGIFQAWKLDEDERKKYGLHDLELVEQPLKRIDYQPRSDGKGGKGRGGYSGRGRGKRSRGQVRRGQMDRAQANGSM